MEADFADGARFVGLAPCSEPQDVAGAIVAALGIVPHAGESPAQATERFLAAKHLLLVAGQLRARARRPRRWSAGCWRRCPGAHGAGDEPRAARPAGRAAPAVRRWRCRPGARGAGVDAVTLFCERARAPRPRLELGDGNAAAVADICRRLDGLPLAIELAAARCALLSPPRSPRASTRRSARWARGARDAPARQRTLRATIDWSHELLDDDEKACFARFAVFAGGATVDAAEAVTGADLDTLDHLVTKSLLVRRRTTRRPDASVDARDGSRLRRRALGRRARRRDAVRERHYRHFLALAERHGDRASAVARRAAAQHLARLDAEVENLHAALGWAVDRPTPGRRSR